MLNLNQSREANELNVEDEGSVGWDDTTGTLGSVAHLWGNSEGGLSTLVHLDDTFIPALDDLSDTNLGLEGSATLDRGIEDVSVG